jgi:hypothetical protein
MTTTTLRGRTEPAIKVWKVVIEVVVANITRVVAEMGGRLF